MSKLGHIFPGDVDTTLFLSLNSMSWEEGPVMCPSSRCLLLNYPESPEQEAAKPVLVHCIWESKYQWGRTRHSQLVSGLADFDLDASELPGQEEQRPT